MKPIFFLHRRVFVFFPDNVRSSQKGKDLKRDEELDDVHNIDKADIRDKTDESISDLKKEGNVDHQSGTETGNSNTIKRNFSDIDEEECDDLDDFRKRKRKEGDVLKESKPNSSLRLPNRPDKIVKQGNNVKCVLPNLKNVLSDKEDLQKAKSIDSEVDDDDSKSDTLTNGSLKVPPLKIVIPQQNCSIDTDGNGSRTGKLNTSRSAALPYVVSSNNDSNDREIPSLHTSPRDSPIKISNSCAIGEEKNYKHLNEEKNLRVLRSAHRVGVTNERSSNNSSPQIPSNSPSPASLTTNEAVDSKIPYANSPPPQHVSFDQDNILNLPSPSASSTSSSKEMLSNNELHPRKRKIKAKNDETAKGNTGNSDLLICSDSHPHDLPFTNCFQMYMNIRKQIERKWKNLIPVKPRPPQGFTEYLIHTRKYVLQSNKTLKFTEIPISVSPKMKEIFLIQQKDRLELYQRHIVEKEKLCLNVEQEIIRIHSKAARCMACQSLPFSACTFIKDEEVYNMLTIEQEDKDRNVRYRFNGRLLLSWLQDVDDKWEKIKVIFDTTF